ncbi:hypothetical protein NADE_000056 [Nannochloris sp. 'desiccata']|nr:hypothetical protein NADE_000056 [Chlorella desiccata (nom. nud.)]
MPEVWPDFSKTKVDPDIEDTFFNRKEEYDMIMDHLNRKPTVPLLLLGPKNSGKSALLSSIIKQEKPRVLYLNCGVKDVSSPELMARQLRNLARKLPSQLGMQFIRTAASRLGPLSNLYKVLFPPLDNTAPLDAAAPTEDILNAFFVDFFPEDKATDLMAVIDTYNFLLENIPPGQKKPIIVIDEANALTLWKRKDAVALKQLLEFFKRSCKEIHTAHIVLATSEFFLVSWLESQGFDENVRRDEVLGDLTSAEAFCIYL